MPRPTRQIRIKPEPPEADFDQAAIAFTKVTALLLKAARRKAQDAERPVKDGETQNDSPN